MIKTTKLNKDKLEKLIKKKFWTKANFARALSHYTWRSFLNFQQQISKILGRQDWFVSNQTLELYCEVLDCEIKDLNNA